MEDTFDGRNREHSNHYLQGFSIIPGSLGFLNHQRILPFPPQEKKSKIPRLHQAWFHSLAPWPGPVTNGSPAENLLHEFFWAPQNGGALVREIPSKFYREFLGETMIISAIFVPEMLTLLTYCKWFWEWVWTVKQNTEPHRVWLEH